MALSLLYTASETTVLCLICLAAVIGNVSLFLIVYKNRKLRTVTNMYILNLAAADILVSVLSMPVTVVTIIKQRWVFGHTACKVFGFFTILSFIASVMSLGMIAVNRYFYIVKWNTYTNTFSKRKALFYGVAVWIVSISLASPPLFGWAEYRFIPGKSYCFVYWPSNVYFMYFMITVCFFGPLSVMAFSYYNILTFTRASIKRVRPVMKDLATPCGPHEPSTRSERTTDNNSSCTIQLACNEVEEPGTNMYIENMNDNSEVIEAECVKAERPQMRMENKNAKRPQLKRSRTKLKIGIKSSRHKFCVTPEEAKITNTFLIVVVLFMICWAPFAITMFFDVYYHRPLPRMVDIISLLLGYLNSMCNPILYGMRNDAFKRGFLNLYSRFIPKRSGPANVIQELETESNINALDHNLETGSCTDQQRTLPRDSSIDIYEYKEECFESVAENV